MLNLVGFQITEILLSGDEDDVSWGFVAERDPHGKPTEKRRCWVDCDPEGNGPGFIQIERIE